MPVMMKRIVKYMVVSLLVLVCGLILGACVLLNHPKFGKAPEGARLIEIEKSPNYVDGEFRNLVDTPKFTQDASTFSILLDHLLNPPKRLTPEQPIPSVKTALKTLDPATDIVIWLGHSSYYIQIGGKRVLLDPLLSDHAAPFSFLNKAFAGTTIYTAEDMPEIDYLLISHEHWDHMDYPTAEALKNKVNNVICPIGIGAYFETWGYDTSKISEGDWYDQFEFGDVIKIHLLPARHYSNRLLKENQVLWAGFVLESEARRLFFSGDSGYGPHFSEIGRQFGGFDFAALDCGQYDERWANIHMNPEEAVAAAKDLNAAMLLPSHIGRFTIARHAWDEPFIRVTSASEGEPFKLLTPLIGEPVRLDDKRQEFAQWWVDISQDGSAVVNREGAFSKAN